MSHDGVGEVRQTRVQPMGGSYRMDMILTVDGSMTVSAAHDLAHDVEEAILAEFDRLTEVHVHVEPIEADFQ
ncbi:MAG: cation transporter dimerization domain-containing protein [Planctomycetota bacterium]